MNDFTKEELKDINDALLYATTALPQRTDRLVKIRDKINIRIDNYCDHEFIQILAPGQGFVQKELTAIPVCRKCKASPRIVK